MLAVIEAAVMLTAYLSSKQILLPLDDIIVIVRLTTIPVNMLSYIL